MTRNTTPVRLSFRGRQLKFSVAKPISSSLNHSIEIRVKITTGCVAL